MYRVMSVGVPSRVMAVVVVADDGDEPDHEHDDLRKQRPDEHVERVEVLLRNRGPCPRAEMVDVLHQHTYRYRVDTHTTHDDDDDDDAFVSKKPSVPPLTVTHSLLVLLPVFLCDQ